MTQTEQGPITGEPRDQEQDGCHQFENTRTDASIRFHTDHGKQFYGLRVGREFKIQGLQQDYSRHHTQDPNQNITDIHIVVTI